MRRSNALHRIARPATFVCAALACMACDAVAQAPLSLAGCYDLHLGEWGPGPLPGADSLYMALPPRIRLDTLPAQGWMSRTGAYQAGPAPGAMPSVHDIVNWEPIAGDSIRVIWSTGFSGVTLVFAHDEDVLVGRAESFWDYPRAHQRAEARAVPVSCTAPG